MVGVGGGQKKVTGETYAPHAKPYPVGQIEADHRKRDGNADTPFEDVGEERVADVVVVDSVAAESVFDEQPALPRLEAVAAVFGENCQSMFARLQIFDVADMDTTMRA